MIAIHYFTFKDDSFSGEGVSKECLFYCVIISKFSANWYLSDNVHKHAMPSQPLLSICMPITNRQRQKHTHGHNHIETNTRLHTDIPTMRHILFWSLPKNLPNTHAKILGKISLHTYQPGATQPKKGPPQTYTHLNFHAPLDQRSTPTNARKSSERRVRNSSEGGSNRRTGAGGFFLKWN